MNTQLTTESRPATASPTGQPRATNVALWTVQVVTAAGFLLVAFAKISGAAAVVATFDAIGLGDWFRYLIAALEIIGAIALLVPRLSGLAGSALVGLMAGAALTHVFVIGDGVVVTLPLLALAAVVAWGRRQYTAALLRRLTNRSAR